MNENVNEKMCIRSHFSSKKGKSGPKITNYLQVRNTILIFVRYNKAQKETRNKPKTDTSKNFSYNISPAVNARATPLFRGNSEGEDSSNINRLERTGHRSCGAPVLFVCRTAGSNSKGSRSGRFLVFKPASV